MMTKQHYIEFARMLAWEHKMLQHNIDQEILDSQRQILNHVTDEMIFIFKNDNTNFDEDKFRQFIAKHSV
jgi:hypothetical protein